MTDEELGQIRARAEAATPAPWSAWEETVWCEPRRADRPLSAVLSLVAEGEVDGKPFPQVPLSQLLDSPQWQQSKLNVDFVAHAREDVPALLAEVERLRAENTAMRARDVKARAILAAIDRMTPQSE